MTKQQTLELLEKQMPSFYSLEQVVDIIKGIEDPAPTVGLSKAQIAYLINLICDTVSNNAGNLSTRDVCDIDSAEFELYRNEISLTSVDVDADKIASTVVVGIDDVIETFFKGLENEVKG